METTARATAMAAKQSVAASDSPTARHRILVIRMTSQRTIPMDAVGVQWQLEHGSVTCIHINRLHAHQHGVRAAKRPNVILAECRRLYPRNSKKILGS